MVKSRIAFWEVPELVTLASVPGSPVVIVPTDKVAAVPAAPSLPAGPVGPVGPVGAMLKGKFLTTLIYINLSHYKIAAQEEPGRLTVKFH